MSKYYSFATYADMRQEWVIKADSLEEAKKKIGDDPNGDWLRDAEMVDTDFTDGRSDFVVAEDDMPMVEEMDLQGHDVVFLSTFEKQEIEAERRRSLPADSFITSDLTRFDAFEIQPVNMFRNWESVEPSFTCEPCDESQATFWTVYGHYDPKLEVNKGFGGVEALIDCWSLHDAQKLAAMFSGFRELQLKA